jgi:membrane protein YdbS with pleckstrin-like domain
MIEKNNDQQKFQFFYRTYANDIENAKRRQWAIPYYILLLFAAVLLVHKLGVKSCTANLLLPLLAFIISLFGIYHVFDVHFVLVRYRMRLGNLINDRVNLTHTYKYTRPDPGDSNPKRFLFSFTMFFSGIIAAGFICVSSYFKAHWSLCALGLVALFFCGEMTYRIKHDLRRDDV